MSVTAINPRQENLPGRPAMFEVIDSTELAQRWCLPETWVRDQVRARIADPIPCVRLGKYVRFEWGSQALEEWWARRRTGSGNGRLTGGRER